MKIGLTTYSFGNKDFREQLSSMLKNGIKPDFIILHYGGKYKFLKGFNFLKKTLNQQRFKSISFLLSYKKSRPTHISGYKLNEEEAKVVDRFISSATIINTKGINSASAITTISELGDVIIACNSGKLNSEVLNLPNAIFLNVHASKLPAYRGMNNVEWALWENCDIYATVHRISKMIDEGDILLQEKIDTAKSELKIISDYREYSFYKGNELMGKAIQGYLKKEIHFTKQEPTSNPLSQYYIMHPILKEYLQKKLSGR
ncbi:MAG TPA: formyltransferase family protein [Bacteroidia bacterium]|jgi:folate-dependent phosphoribosylglycinamide formyltransferase PurN|nr:formyltransferase family protein [Bacteroidia bacterium]